MAERQLPASEHLFAKVQLGIRMNRIVVKVLKATAEYMDMPFSGLLENMVLANFEGQRVFSPDVLKQIERFSEIYGLNQMLEVLAKEAEDYNQVPETLEPPRKR